MIEYVLARRCIPILALALLPATATADDDAKLTNPWAAISAPLAGTPTAIGGYSAGCVRGAVALPDAGPGFQLARPSRGRNYGHPSLVAFVRDLGAAVKKKKLGVLFVADLGQPRGGPAPSGHSSHQTGLDADIWYWHPPAAERRALPRSRRERLSAPAIVSLRHKSKTRRFTREVRGKLEIAARDRRVSRIFVNPLIKRELCRSVPKRKRGWLRKLRPWWGHHRHFHVRLHCPEGSPDCQPQDPIGEGDGCDELDWWLDEKAQADRRKSRKGYSDRVRSLPELPAACQALL